MAFFNNKLISLELKLYSIIIPTLNSMAIGLAIFFPEISGAEPCTGSYSPNLSFFSVAFIDAEGTFDSNNLTVEPGSEKIMGQTAGDEMVVDTNNAAFALVYQDSTHGWRFREK